MDKDSEELQALVRDLVPINGLAAQYQTEVINQSEIVKIKKRQLAFKQGERDDLSFYVLQGELDLIADEQLVKQVTGGTDASRYALAQLQPRQMSGKARTEVLILKVDRQLLDRLLTLDEKGDGGQVVVSDIDAEESMDWMTKLLQSELFARIPPTNIQKIFTTMESVDVEAGAVIVEQGAPGDYYYYIQHGSCVVSRKTSPNSDAIALAELTNGDSFGEEALVSDVVRNASVSMLTDGTLMRLTKEDFVDLIKKPVLNSVSYLKAESLAAQGYRWLDVRFSEEHADSGVDGSMNVPLNMLRVEVSDLDVETPYIVYCDTGARSSVAAFLLSQIGFQACHLRGGLMNTPLAPEVRTPARKPSAAEPSPAAKKRKVQKPPDKPAVVELPPEPPSVEDEELDADIRASAIDAQLAKADLQLQDAMTQKAEAEKAQRQVREEREKLGVEAANLKKQAEAAKRKLAQAAKGKILEERGKLEQEAKHLRDEAEAARVVAEQAAAKRLEEERAKRDAQAAEATTALEEAKRLRLELEAAKRSVDEEVEANRRAEEERSARLQEKAEARLRAQSAKLEAEYNRNAEELARVRKERKDAEEKLRIERSRMEAAAADAQTKLEEARRLNQETQALRRAVEIEVEEKREAQEAMERKMREEVNQKIKAERRKLEAEFGRHTEEMDRVRREREAADAARAAAQEEAARIIAEYKEAHERTVAEYKEAHERTVAEYKEAHELAVAEQEQTLLEERKRLESEVLGVREVMASAERSRAEAVRAREEAETTRQATEQRMQEFRAEEQRSADAKAAESVEEAALKAELAAIEAEVDEAQVQLQAAERAAVAAKKANEADMVKQVGAETQMQEQLRIEAQEQLRIEAQEWRAEMDAKERKMEKAHDLVLEKEQIERIKRKAQEAKRQNEEANDSLLGDISAQLNG